MGRKLKIGIVCYPTVGGSGVVATELGKELAKDGHQIHFVSYDQPIRLNHLLPNIYFHEVAVSNYPLFEYQPYELVLTSKLVDVVRHEKLDILHVHYAIPHASAAYMATQILKTYGINIPFITTLHGTDITLVGKDASFEPVITFAINHSNAVTAVSDNLKMDTLQHFKVSNRVEVIPNFICSKSYENQFKPSLKKTFAPNGEKIILHVSNFRKVKRVEDVVHIFKNIHKQMPSKLILAGDGPERRVVEDLCRSLGVCKDLIFLGKLTDTREVMAIADLFLLPSLTESFGMAALESMASGVPVIASNTGGLPEVIDDGKSGYLHPVGAIDKMSESAIKILSDQSLSEVFKKNAKINALRFDVAKVLPLYTNLYYKCIEGIQ